jgi:photosystem II stability/assembly factor-like uncharacterized protein
VEFPLRIQRLIDDKVQILQGTKFRGIPRIPNLFFMKSIPLAGFFILCIAAGCGKVTDHAPADLKLNGAYEALTWLSAQRAYPSHDIPKDAYRNAIRDSRELFQESDGSRSIDPWESRGPWNTAGRTLSVAINPQNDRTLYAGSASGGLWRSYNQGEGISWERISLGFPVLAVSTIAFAPGDSMTIYIGTGEVYNLGGAGTGAAYRSTRGIYGIGILKSVDGGDSWFKILDTEYGDQMGVWSVRVANTNPDIVFAATTHGLYKSKDAGEHWELILNVAMVTDVVISPSNANIIIAGCGNFGSSGKGIYRSTDGGQNWSIAGAPVPDSFQGKIQLAIAPSNPNVIYASIGNGFNGANGASWLLRSGNTGFSWVLKSTEDYSKWQGWFSHDVAVHPSNPEEIIVVGIDVWKSIDGGTTLEQVTSGGLVFGTPPLGLPESVHDNFSHSDHHDVIYNPKDPQMILLANDGGVNRSLDGGVTFGTINGGLQTAQFYNGFSISPLDPELSMGGLQDNSTIIYSGDEAWYKTYGGDGAWTAMHPFYPGIMYTSSQYLNIGRSVDGGQSWTYITPPSNNENTAFIAPYAISPSNASVIYAGRSTIYKSINGGDDWFATNNGQPLNGDPALCIAVSHSNDQVCYVGTAPYWYAAAIWLTMDGGASWQNITTGLPDRFPTDLAVDPSDHAVAYCTFSGFGQGHLFKTENFGENWRNISIGLPDVPGQSVIVDPKMPEHVYYGDDLHVYFSPDGGDSWELFMHGLPEAVQTMDLKISLADRKLWVASHGNGAYRRDLVSLSVSTDQPDISIVGFRNYPNPFNERTHIDFTLTGKTKVSFEIFDQSGKQVDHSISEEAYSAGDHTISMNTGHWPSGIYFGIIRIENQDPMSIRMIKVQ